MIDISVPLQSQMPIWPESIGYNLTQTMRLEAGDPANVSRLDCDVHVGTHIDAPRHFVQDGDTIEQIPLELLVGPTVVGHMPDIEAITAKELADLGLPPDTQRLLLRTRNSKLWAVGEAAFKKDYVALTPDAARWVVEQDIRLIGVDYLSVQRFHDGPETHQILLGAGVVILEGLDLTDVKPGTYELVCLPLKLVGAEGAPARAILR